MSDKPAQVYWHERSIVPVSSSIPKDRDQQRHDAYVVLPSRDPVDRLYETN